MPLAAALATPFIDPLDAHRLWWVFLVPLALLISLAYKAVRQPTLDHIVREVALMTAQVLIGMIALGAALFVFIEWIVPALVTPGT